MIERKFTDEDIIKALEFCASNKYTCDGCPCVEDKFECVTNDPKFALDLINRQRTEIERLHSEVKEKTETIVFLKDQATGWSIDFCNLKAKLNTAKAEAIKEFAESMKKREGSNAYCCFCAHATIYGDRAKECDEPYIDKDGKEHSHCLMFSKFESYIDKLVKEKTEGE